MQNPFHNFDWSFKSIAKVFGLFLVGIIALSLVAMLVTFAFRMIAQPLYSGVSNVMTSDYNYKMAVPEMAMSGRGGGVSYDSSYYATQNILPPIPGEEGVPTDAEDYEVTSYNANYQVNDKTGICESVAALKADKDIIFSNASDSERSCYFYFKVLKEKTPEILALLESFDPEDLSSNTYTIQKAVEGVTDRLEVLQKKLAQTEETLLDAQTSYKELLDLATRKGDTESLTKLVDLKINTISRLAQEKISISAEMEDVERSRADLLEKLDYNEFSVNVSEDRLIDWESMGKNWKYEIQKFFTDLNGLTQQISVKLVSFALNALVGIVYLGIGFIFLKGAWILGKKVWFYKKK